MSKTIEIKIPVMVGSNGKWGAIGWETEADPDWDGIEDNLIEWPTDKMGEWHPILPMQTKKYFVTAVLEVPDGPEDVDAIKVEEAGQS